MEELNLKFCIYNKDVLDTDEDTCSCEKEYLWFCKGFKIIKLQVCKGWLDYIMQNPLEYIRNQDIYDTNWRKHFNKLSYKQKIVIEKLIGIDRPLINNQLYAIKKRELLMYGIYHPVYVYDNYEHGLDFDKGYRISYGEYIKMLLKLQTHDVYRSDIYQYMHYKVNNVKYFMSKLREFNEIDKRMCYDRHIIQYLNYFENSFKRFNYKIEDLLNRKSISSLTFGNLAEKILVKTLKNQKA